MVDTKKRRPAKSPQEQENRLISLAMKQAETMLEEGKAPVAVVVHFLKLGATNSDLHKDKLVAETEMTKAKGELLKSQKQTEELLTGAISAFKKYSTGVDPSEGDQDEEL